MNNLIDDRPVDSRDLTFGWMGSKSTMEMEHLVRTVNDLQERLRALEGGHKGPIMNRIIILERQAEHSREKIEELESTSGCDGHDCECDGITQGDLDRQISDLKKDTSLLEKLKDHVSFRNGDLVLEKTKIPTLDDLRAELKNNGVLR